MRLALATGLLSVMTNLFRPEYTRSLLEVVTGLTDNRDLQTMFMYCWGDYGCPPSKTTFVMQVSPEYWPLVGQYKSRDLNTGL